MPRHRAALIQDVLEYSEMIKPFLSDFMRQNHDPHITEESIIKWIIVEQLERVYYLFTDDHYRHLKPYEQLFFHVVSCIACYRQVSLDALTSFYIKAPKLYSDNSLVQIELSGRDLIILYTSDITLT